MVRTPKHRVSRDGIVIEKAINGSAEAIASLVDRYGVEVRRTVSSQPLLRSVGCSSDMDDVVQIVWTIVLRKLTAFDTTKPFGPWVRQTAMQAAFTHARSLVRQRRHVVPFYEEPGVTSLTQHRASLRRR